jgi:hypothetical protein
MTSGSGFFDAIMNMGAERTDAEPEPQKVADTPAAEMVPSKLVTPGKPALTLALSDFPVLSPEEATRLFRASCEVSRRVNTPAPDYEPDSEFFARRGFTFSVDNPDTHPRLKRGERPTRPAPIEPDASLTASERARRQIEERAKLRATVTPVAPTTPTPARVEPQSSAPALDVATPSQKPDNLAATLSETATLDRAMARLIAEPEGEIANPEPEGAPSGEEALSPVPEHVEAAPFPHDSEMVTPEVAEPQSEAEPIEPVQAPAPVVDEHVLPDESDVATPLAKRPSNTAGTPPLEWVSDEGAQAASEADIEPAEITALAASDDDHAAADIGVTPEEVAEPDVIDAPAPDSSTPATTNVVSTRLSSAFSASEDTAATAEPGRDDEPEVLGAWDLYEEKLRRL